MGLAEKLAAPFNWFKRMIDYVFSEGVDYTTYQMVHPQNQQILVDYNLTIDMAKEISMIQRIYKESKRVNTSLKSNAKYQNIDFVVTDIFVHNSNGFLIRW